MPVYREYKVHFFRFWSRDMAYILGFIFADGNIIKTRRGTLYISIYSSDLDLIRRMRLVVGSNHKISIRKSKYRDNYRLQIGSKIWYQDLKTLGVFSSKSKRMRLPKIPSKYFSDFVRGYFDGDGNVWVGYINKSRLKPTKIIQVSFTSCSNKFLNELLISLRKNNITGGYLYTPKTKNFSRLTFSTRDSLKLCEIMYNIHSKLLLDRKRMIFQEFIKGLNN